MAIQNDLDSNLYGWLLRDRLPAIATGDRDDAAKPRRGIGVAKLDGRQRSRTSQNRNSVRAPEPPTRR